MAASVLDVVGAAAWALVEVAGRPWLLVRGRRDPVRGGIVSSVEIVEAGDLDEAREKLVALVGEDSRRRELASAFEGMVRAARKGR